MLMQFKFKKIFKFIRTHVPLISAIIMGLAFSFSIYKFYFEYVSSPMKEERNAIIQSYIAANSAMQNLNEYCRTKYKAMNSAAQDKALIKLNETGKESLIQLTLTGKNVSHDFDSTAHDILACYIRKNWARVNSTNSCDYPLETIQELDEKQNTFFDELHKPADNKIISHAEWDKNLKCH